MSNFNISKKASIAIIFIVFILVLTPISFLRHLKGEPLAFGESYFTLRMAETIQSGGIPGSDNYLSTMPEYSFSLIHYILSPLPNKEFFMIITPLLLGLLSALLFYSLLSQYKLDEEHKLSATILLIISPPFIFSFINYSAYSFFLFLTMLFLLLYTKKQSFPAALVLLPLILINPFLMIISAIILLLIDVPRRTVKKGLIYSAVLIVFSLVSYYFLYYSHFIPGKLFFEKNTLLLSTISDFGALAGFGVFQIILAIVGFVFLFIEKKKYRLHYIFAIIAFFFSTYFLSILIILNLAVAFFASYAFFRLYEAKWELSSLKTITIILIACGILFSAISYEKRMIDSPPLTSDVQALSFLKSQPEGVVLSHQSNGYIIEYFADKTAFVDERTYFESSSREIFEDLDTLFYSRRISSTKKLLTNYNIKYIYIDNEMKNGAVWTEEGEGLLFLLKNSKDFQKIYEQNGHEIWVFIPQS